MASLHFLRLKGFDPGNHWNRKRVWIAEQNALAEKKREEERAELVRRERRKQEEKVVRAHAWGSLRRRR